MHENLQIGGQLARDQKVIDSRIAEVYELLARLQERGTQQGGTLSRGEQHRQQTTSSNR